MPVLPYAQAAARAAPPSAAQHLFPGSQNVITPPPSHVIQPPIQTPHHLQQQQQQQHMHFNQHQDYPKHFEFDQHDDKNNETFDTSAHDVVSSLSDISTATMDKLNSSGPVMDDSLANVNMFLDCSMKNIPESIDSER